MEKVGCQPHWRRFNVSGMPLCDNWISLTEFGNLNTKIQLDMEMEEITKTTKCMIPCTFMEYKVRIKIDYLTWNTKNQQCFVENHLIHILVCRCRINNPLIQLVASEC